MSLSQRPPTRLLSKKKKARRRTQRGAEVIEIQELRSEREIARAEQLAEAAKAKQEGTQDLGFYLREFILCSLPYKPLTKGFYVRQNGHLELTIYGNPRYGLPYGQDRLLLLWVISAFHALGQPENNLIRFRAASDIPKSLGSAPWGSELTRLRERFDRLFGLNYQVTDRQAGKARFLGRGTRLFEYASLWFERDEARHPRTLWQNVIELSPQFANELRRGSVPVDLHMVRLLRRKTAALDLYLFESYRSYRLYKENKSELVIPVFGKEGLLAQLGTQLSSPRYKAKQLVRRWQAEVSGHWLSCPNELTEDGEQLVIRPACAVNPASRLMLSGVSRTPPVPLLSLEELKRPDLEYTPPPEKTPPHSRQGE